MINWLLSWWRSYQFKLALKKGKLKQAEHIFKQIDKSGEKLSTLEKLYKKQLKIANNLTHYQQENNRLTRRLQEVSSQDYKLKVDSGFIAYIHNCFKLKLQDKTKIQCTGIEPRVFEELEIALVDFLETELNKISQETRDRELSKAIQDLEGLKKGIDPQYNLPLSPHVYLSKYFLENIYCSYLSWFLIYQHDLLPRNIKILDLAAGPGTTIYGLAMLLFSTREFFSLPTTHISYYSLEQQANLQYRGLQFWRSYIESRSPSINAYFRFNTFNLFDYQNYSDKLPEDFFDFIVISHCFFYQAQLRQQSHKIYRQIFQQNLTSDGRILLIIQGRKLFAAYDVFQTEDIADETMVIEMFLEELNLKLDWYHYLTSTGLRMPIKTGFTQFASNNLPSQPYLDNLR
jgi:hypothetical protein